MVFCRSFRQNPTLFYRNAQISLAEQFVGQQLLCNAASFADPQLFYWTRETRNANAEVDFVINRQQEILPVEVKAGKTGTLRSAFQFLREKRRRCAVRFHTGPPVLEEIKLPGETETLVQLLSLPLYLVGQLDRLLRETFGHEAALQGTEQD